MTFKEIQDLIKLVSKTELAEFKLKQKDFELSVRTKNYAKSPNITQVSSPAMPSIITAAAPAPAAVQESAALESTTPDLPPPAAEDANANLIEVKSPIVGTFYRSPSPDKPPFFKVGDQINVGDVVCIVEAMKLFNEIESEVSGKVVKIVTEDASPVEYDQVLFLLDPKG